MRLINAKNVIEGMTLGKTVYDAKGNVILPAGTNLMKYTKHLENFKIGFIYVNDELSKDIEPISIISEKTRKEIHSSMDKARLAFRPMDNPYAKTTIKIPYYDLAKCIAEDVAALKDNRIDVTELQTNRMYVYEHDINVGIISALIGKMLGMVAVDLERLALGGLLHDIGFLGVPGDVMRKVNDGKQTDYDLDFYRRYPRIGYDMIKQDGVLDVSTKAAVLQHLENFNGTGFPLRKKGSEITQAGRIVAIANAFDEVLGGSSIQFGHKPMKVYEAVEYVQNNAGTLFDPEIAGAFVTNAVVFPNGTLVKLSDGSKGIVINQNPKLVSRPIVRIVEGGRRAVRVVNLLEEMSLVIDDIEI